MGDWAAQSGAGVRFEWGPAGADRLVTAAACLVVVDVLSFTTAVSVAVEKGTQILPFWCPSNSSPVPSSPASRRRPRPMPVSRAHGWPSTAPLSRPPAPGPCPRTICERHLSSPAWSCPPPTAPPSQPRSRPAYGWSPPACATSLLSAPGSPPTATALPTNPSPSSPRVSTGRTAPCARPWMTCSAPEPRLRPVRPGRGPALGGGRRREGELRRHR
jgi:hypothetical protein